MRLIDADRLNEVLLKRYGLATLLREVEIQPTIDPIKHGEWIKRNTVGTATCSICGGIIYDSYDRESNKYCGHCGAKMDAKEGG